MRLLSASGLQLLGGSLLFAVLYYWSRRESYTPVSIYFLTVQGHQLPFVLLLLHLLMGRDLWPDAIGLLSGHLYYFFREILPAQGEDLEAVQRPHHGPGEPLLIRAYLLHIAFSFCRRLSSFPSEMLSSVVSAWCPSAWS